LRLQDENSNCFSEGFQTILSEGNHFTIKQQNCSNKYIIKEYITFKYTNNKNQIYLHEIQFIYIDKSNNKIHKEYLFGTQDFGSITFNEVNLKSSYLLLQAK